MIRLKEKRPDTTESSYFTFFVQLSEKASTYRQVHTITFRAFESVYRKRLSTLCLASVFLHQFWFEWSVWSADFWGCRKVTRNPSKCWYQVVSLNWFRRRLDTFLDTLIFLVVFDQITENGYFWQIYALAGPFPAANFRVLSSKKAENLSRIETNCPKCQATVN